MKTALVLGVFLAFACGCFASDLRLETKVSAGFGCLPLGELLPKLGAQAGVRLEARGVAKDMLAFAAFKDKPLSEVMKRIATTFDLTWTKTGDDAKPSYVLRQSDAQRKKLEDEKRAAWRAAVLNAAKNAQAAQAELRRIAGLPEDVRKGLLDGLARYRKGGIPDEDAGVDLEEAATCSELQNADARIALDVMSGLSGSAWETVFDRGRAVYSTHPSGASIPLANKYADLCKKWIGELQQGVQSSGIPPDAQGWTDITSVEANRKALVMAERTFGADAPQDVRVTLVAKGHELEFQPFDGLSIAVALLDKHGEVVAKEREAGLEFGSELGPLADDVPAGADDPLLDQPYELPAEIVKLATEPFAFGEEYRKRAKGHFLEPLDLVPGAALTDVAAKFHVPILARVTDGMFVSWFDEGQHPLKEVLKETGHGDVHFAVRDGWLVSSPTIWVRLTEDPSCPRPLLRQFLAPIGAGGVPSIDLVARAERELGEKRAGHIRSMVTSMWPTLDWDEALPIEVWDALGPQFKAAVRMRGELDVDRLPPGVQKAVRKAQARYSPAYDDYLDPTDTDGGAGDHLRIRFSDGIPGYLMGGANRWGWQDARSSYDPLMDPERAYLSSHGTADSRPMAEIVRGTGWMLELEEGPWTHWHPRAHCMTQVTSEDVVAPEDYPPEVRAFFERGRLLYEDRQRREKAGQGGPREP